MVFSSVVFLFYFVPLFFLLYFALGRSNLVLLAASVAFYAWGELAYLWLLALVVAATWLGGHAIAGQQRRGGRGLGALGVAVLFELAVLAWFKYSDFLRDQLAAVGAAPPRAADHLALPLGISFFTFHAISYLVDIYRRAVPAPAGPLNLAVYIAMFPQLIAGPIVRYSTIARQIESRRHSLDDVAAGIRLFAIGLAQKVLLANTLAGPADQIFALPQEQLGAATAWLGAACYTLQIYFDFSGYSTMAIGLAAMMGLRYPPNFDHPYVSQSVTEFWRRWHISLSRWFRDYVYIPLGGNRGSAARTYGNLCLVFLLCGLWHGAAWTFVLWGAWHGAFLVIERAGLGRALAWLPSPLRHAYALLVVVLGWVLFRADTAGHAVRYAAALFGGGGEAGDLAARHCPPSVALALLAGAAASVPWAPVWRRLGRSELASVAASAALGLLLLLSAASLASGTYNPFIYFRF